MGRGRAKAKQQKVARELKYNTHFTDLDALQRELGVSESSGGPAPGRAVANGRTPALDGNDADDDAGDDTADRYAYGSERDGESEDDYESWTGTDR